MKLRFSSWIVPLSVPSEIVPLMVRCGEPLAELVARVSKRPLASMSNLATNASPPVASRVTNTPLELSWETMRAKGSVPMTPR